MGSLWNLQKALQIIILMSQDYQTLRASLANRNPVLLQNKAKKNLAASPQILLAIT